MDVTAIISRRNVYIMQKNYFYKVTDLMIFNSIVSFFRKRTNLIVAFFLSITVGTIYFSFSVHITNNVFAPSDFNYYTYLLDAFFHGHTNVTSPSQYDLSLFQNKWYLYWGPAPVLFILPFYLFSHLQASDVLYTAIAGIMNVALFYFIMQEFKKHFHISFSFITDAFLVLSFGLASPNFYLSLVVQISPTHQIF